MNKDEQIQEIKKLARAIERHDMQKLRVSDLTRIRSSLKEITSEHSIQVRSVRELLDDFLSDREASRTWFSTAEIYRFVEQELGEVDQHRMRGSINTPLNRMVRSGKLEKRKIDTAKSKYRLAKGKSKAGRK